MPIRPHFDTKIEAAERARLHTLAQGLLAAEPALSATAPFGASVEQGLDDRPSLLLEDHSAIALADTQADIAYGYRALMLAGTGDLFAIGQRRCPTFEAYCRDILRLGRVEVLVPTATSPAHSLTERCANDEAFVGHMAGVARRNGGLNLVPYMGTGGIWSLASKIAAKAGMQVRVAAPPPRLTRRVNDKIWFAARVAEVLGARGVPFSTAAHSLAALVGRVVALAEGHRSIAVKVPDAASSAGNIVLGSPYLRSLSLGEIRNQIHALLRAAGWGGAFPLMVTAWSQSVLSSPSVQVWIPHRDDGLPVVEGVFDQLVIGPRRVFSGAAPSALPAPRQREVAEQATRLAFLFQALGYFGRCSFDSILVGKDLSAADLHWVECNGRWGGVSIPMTLANRLCGDWARCAPVIADRGPLAGQQWDFGDLLAEFSSDLYRPDKSGAGVVFLSPGRIEAGIGFEVMVLGHDVAATRGQVEAIVQRLTSLLRLEPCAV